MKSVCIQAVLNRGVGSRRLQMSKLVILKQTSQKENLEQRWIEHRISRNHAFDACKAGYGCQELRR